MESNRRCTVHDARSDQIERIVAFEDRFRVDLINGDYLLLDEAAIRRLYGALFNQVFPVVADEVAS